MIHRPPLSLELMIAAMRVHDREPAQRAVLAHALLDDERCAALHPLRFTAAAEELRRLLFGWADHPGGYVYYPYRVEARACGLVSAAQWECSRPALDMAAAVDAVTVGQLAAVGPFEHLLQLADPTRAVRRIRRRERQIEERRDVLPPSREAVA